MDTHALSVPAHHTAIEVLAANGVQLMIAEGNEYTPTPVISHAILTYNQGRKTGLADGIVITPSDNPPQDGGFKDTSDRLVRQIQWLQVGSEQRQTSFLRMACGEEKESLSRCPCVPRRPTGTTTWTPTSLISAT